MAKPPPPFHHRRHGKSLIQENRCLNRSCGAKLSYFEGIQVLETRVRSKKGGDIRGKVMDKPLQKTLTISQSETYKFSKN